MQPRFVVGCKWNAMFESNLDICIAWVRFNYDSILNEFCIFDRSELRTVYYGISKQIQHLQLVSQAAEFKFEPKFEPLQVIWQSFPKIIPENNRRFWLQNQGLSSWGRALAQLGRVWGASINTGRQLQSLLAATSFLEETVLHSCNTDLVSKSCSSWWFVNFIHWGQFKFWLLRTVWVFGHWGQYS